MDSEIKTLIKWLSIKGNNSALLAAKLGYSTSETITRWIERGNIPENRINQVMDVIKPRTKIRERQESRV